MSLAAADVEAERMRASGASEDDITTYQAREYRSSYADQNYKTNLLGDVQFLGDYLTDPVRVGGDALEGILRGFDGVLRDETPVIEYLERTGQSIEDYRNADPLTQARIEGEALATVATVATEAIAGYGAGRAAGIGRRAGGGQDTDTGRVDAGDTSGGLGGTGPYNPQQVQADLEARYGKDNVSSTTLPSSDSRFPELAGREVYVERANASVVFDNRGFPIFDDITNFETRVALKPGDRAADMRAATRSLRDAIDSGKVDASQFNSPQLEAIRGGRAKIPNLTWHHHQDRGRMQLVPSEVHNYLDHIGSVGLSRDKGK